MTETRWSRPRKFDTLAFLLCVCVCVCVIVFHCSQGSFIPAILNEKYNNLTTGLWR